MDLKKALEDLIWKDHKIGDTYSMVNVGGKKDDGNWKIAYYPLDGTYKGEDDKKIWIEFDEPRALIEKPMKAGESKEGSDLREMPLRYLIKNII